MIDNYYARADIDSCIIGIKISLQDWCKNISSEKRRLSKITMIYRCVGGKRKAGVALVLHKPQS